MNAKVPQLYRHTLEKEHMEKFGVEPVIIGMFWSHPEKIDDGLEEALNSGKPYDEYMMLTPEEREDFDNGHLLF